MWCVGEMIDLLVFFVGCVEVDVIEVGGVLCVVVVGFVFFDW